MLHKHRRQPAKKLGFIMGIMLTKFTRKRTSPPTLDDLQRNNFKSSAKKLGLTFPESLRNKLRHQWIRKTK